MALTDLIPFRRHSQSANVPATTSGRDDPFQQLHESMNRLFEEFLPDTWKRSGLADWPRGATSFMPGIDVKDGRKAIEVTAELPGVDDDDLDVRLDGNLLTIRGEKRNEETKEEGRWTCTECSYGSFMRTIPIDAAIDSEKIKATFRNGVLKIKLPKTAERASRGRIEVKAG